jgi:hypothetical protein
MSENFEGRQIKDRLSQIWFILVQLFLKLRLSWSHQTKRVGLVQGRAYHHLIENKLVLAMIYLKTCWVGAKPPTITYYYPDSNQPVFALFP